MDGWMDGWMDGQMDVCVGGWGEWVEGGRVGWMDGWKYKIFYQCPLLKSLADFGEAVSAMTRSISHGMYSGIDRGRAKMGIGIKPRWNDSHSMILI